MQTWLNKTNIVDVAMFYLKKKRKKKKLETIKQQSRN